MKKTFVFLLVFVLSSLMQNAFSLNPSHEGERVVALNLASEEITRENAFVQKFFQSLGGDEQRLFNAVLQSDYSAGYYSELVKVTDAAHYADLANTLQQVEGHLRTLKNGRTYDAILARAEQSVVRFIVGRRAAGVMHGYLVGQRKWVHGTSPDLVTQLSIDRNHYWGALFFGAVYTPSVQGTHYRLKAEEVFPLPAHEVTLKPLPSPELKKSRRFELDLSSVDVGKVFFVSLLSLLAIAITILLIGTYRFPHISVFRKCGYYLHVGRAS